MKNTKSINNLVQKLQALNYSENTISSYRSELIKLSLTLNVDFSRLSIRIIEDYLRSSKISVSQSNQLISSVKLLFKYVLDKKEFSKLKTLRPRKESKLPNIIGKNDLLASISKISNIKHKAIISITYSCGLRVSELINLKIEDIDSDRMLIKVVGGKGNKDRYVPLSENILILLRTYFKKDRPKKYLFNGQSNSKYSATSCNKIVKKYVSSKYSFHTLRHSCFTHLLESGVDLRVIQKIAGHSSSKTTEIYTHVSNRLLGSIVMPL